MADISDLIHEMLDYVDELSKNTAEKATETLLDELGPWSDREMAKIHLSRLIQELFHISRYRETNDAQSVEVRVIS